MIKEIVLQNFMSHKKTIIKPARGLTVIVGPNNCGKSSIVTALRALAYNDLRGDFMIRHGEDQTVVWVCTSEGDKLLWGRGSAVHYEINGGEIHRVGSGVPEEIELRLRLSKVALPGGKGKDFDVHFGVQRSPIFLLDESAAKAAAFFSASSDAGLLLEMQRLHRFKTTTRRQELTVLEREEEVLGERFRVLSPIPKMLRRATELEVEYEELKRLTRDIFELGSLCEAMRREECSLALFTERGVIFEALSSPPDREDTDSLQRLAEQLSPVLSSHVNWEARFAVLSSLRSLPEWYSLVTLSNLEQIGKDLSVLLPAMVRLESLVGVLVLLERPPVLVEVRECAGHLKILKREDERFRLVSERVKSLLGLAPAPRLGEVGSLEETMRLLASFECADSWGIEKNEALSTLREPPDLFLLGALSRDLIELQRRMTAWTVSCAREGALSGLQVSPLFGDEHAFGVFFSRLSLALKAAHRCRDEWEVLSALEPVPRVERSLLSSMEFHIEKQSLEAENHSKAEEREALLSALGLPLQMKERSDALGKLQELIKKMVPIFFLDQKNQACLSVLSELRECEKILDPSFREEEVFLENTLREMQEMGREVEASKRAVEGLSVALLEAEEDAREKDAECCPTCGGAWVPGHFLDHLGKGGEYGDG